MLRFLIEGQRPVRWAGRGKWLGLRPEIKQAAQRQNAPARLFPVFNRLADVSSREFLGLTRWRVVLV